MSSSRRYKTAVYQQIARVSRALASPTRLELLDLLAQGPRTVERLAEEASQGVANTSQHLRLLREARLVEAQKDGLFVTYRLAADEVSDLYRSLRSLAETRLTEIERMTRDFLDARGLLEPVDDESLIERVRDGRVVVIDVRPEEEYRAGHIPGARSIPLEELERRLTELPRRREIVAYCRGPYCMLALDAVARLRARGMKAARLKDGVPEWRARGLPVEVGAEE